MMVFANGTSNYTNINIAEDTSAQNMYVIFYRVMDVNRKHCKQMCLKSFFVDPNSLQK